MANPDPEGEHLKPPTRRETARTLAVIGWLLVLAAIFMFFFLGVIDDIQATGGSVTTWITGVTFLVGIVLLVVGNMRKTGTRGDELGE
jgi:hypothetical protein